MANASEKTESEQQVSVSTKKEPAEARRPGPARALSPFEEMERFFGEFFPRGWLRPFRPEWPAWGETTAMPFEGRLPRVDVIDRDDELVLRAELPGVDKKDLDVSMSENTVTIKGATSHEEKVEKGDYYRCEMSHGSFSRTVALPGEVDGTKAKASFKDGILELSMPKLAKAKRHAIKVD